MLTEYVGNCRSVDEIHSIAWSNLKLARQKHDLFFSFLSVFSDPENVCINSHPQLEAPLYYDSVDQYTLGTMNYDRWPDNCMNDLIALSGNEVALWDFLFIKKDNLEFSIVHYK